MIDEKIIKEFKFEQPPTGKIYGVASSDDIGFKFRGKFVSLQDMFERQRVSEVLIAVALVVSLSHAFCSIFIN
jgi:hypothetical protein